MGSPWRVDLSAQTAAVSENRKEVMEKWRLFDHIIWSVPEAEQTRTLYDCSKLLINMKNQCLYVGINVKL